MTEEWLPSETVRLFWWNAHRNFGDGLAPLLISRFAGLEPRWSRPATSEAVIIGSIARLLPRRYYGVVVGIGKFHDGVRIDLSRASVLGLRGELTKSGSGARGDIVLGDPGLLAADLLLERPPVIYPLGVVAHFKDPRLAVRYPDAHHISVELDPIKTITEIASCERIVSSSLHGIVTADAFGIPRRWEYYDQLKGGHFKFHDYATALGMKLSPDAWGTAQQSAVESVRASLRDVFREIPVALAAASRPRLWRAEQVLDAAVGRVTRR